MDRKTPIAIDGALFDTLKQLHNVLDKTHSPIDKIIAHIAPH